MGGIWTKLSAALGIALAAVIVLGLLGMNQFRTVREISAVFSDIWIPEVESISRMRSGLITYHHLSTHELGDTLHAASHENLDQARAAAWTDILQASGRYAEVVDAQSEMDQFEEFESRLAEYANIVDRVLALASSGQRADAETMFWMEADVAHAAVMEQLDLLFAIAKKEGVEGALLARDLYNRFALETGLAAAFALILLLATSAWVRRSIVRPIETVSEALRRLDKGNLKGVDIPASDRKDEIGTLLNAAHRYRDNLVAKRDLEAAFQQERGRLHTAIASMPLGFVMFDRDRKLVLCNEMFARIYDLPESLIQPGTDVEAIFDHIEENRTIEYHDYEAWRSEARQMTTASDASSVVRQTNSGRITTANVYPLKQGGWISLFEDITDKRKAQEEVAFLYSHDHLTRVAKREHLEAAIDTLLGQDTPVAVHVIDLDRLAVLNEMLGHAAIDGLLRDVAQRIAETIGPADEIGRLGGDEFAVAQVGFDGPEQVRSLAVRILDIFNRSLPAGERAVSVNVNIGIAISPGDGTSAEDLIHNAVIAMNRAKAVEQDTFRFYESGMDAAMQARRALETALATALENDEFELHYQPIIDLDSGSVLGFEALLRWYHPTLGMVPPTRFIPLAEERGLIQSIGAWVVREATRFAAKIEEPQFVAINLSPAQLDDGIGATVSAALAASGVKGDRLEFEVTETLFLSDAEHAMKALSDLRELGARLVLDDFGKGYSNLGYLLTFRFDKIKIDREFIQKAPANPDSVAIIRAIVSLSRSLDMTVIAEGIETPAELDLVRDFDCDEAQGYFIARPMNEAAAMLKARLLASGSGSALGA